MDRGATTRHDRRDEDTKGSSAMRVRDARHPIGVIAGASWLVATMALALLWCGSAFAAQPKVVLLRGGRVFSTGMDSLADELKAKGIHAQVAGHCHGRLRYPTFCASGLLARPARWS